MKGYVIAAALAVLVSQPLPAQSPRPQPGRDPAPVSPAEAIDAIGARIDRDVKRGAIPAPVAKDLRAELAALRVLQLRYRNFDPRTRERTDLMRRIDALRMRVDVADRHASVRPPVARPFDPDRQPFADPPRSSGLEGAYDRTIGSADRRPESDRYSDDVRDMNAIRGPAPPKRDEGS